MKKLIEFAKNFIQENPKYKQEVLELIQLCKDEIDEGGSLEHECCLAIESIKQLIEQ